jgi:hypothetical protein
MKGGGDGGAFTACGVALCGVALCGVALCAPRSPSASSARESLRTKSSRFIGEASTEECGKACEAEHTYSRCAGSTSPSYRKDWSPVGGSEREHSSTPYTCAPLPAKTLKTSSHTISAETEYSSGTAEVTENRQHCGYRNYLA